MASIIVADMIENTAAMWRVWSGKCTCGRYRFYHAGCGHLHKERLYRCGRKKGVTKLFCSTLAPCHNVDVVKISGMCAQCRG